MRKYKKDEELKMKRFYDSLSEKDRRRYAAIEALKLDFGGKKYISEVLDCDYATIEKGIKEFESEELNTNGERQQGAGRKKILNEKPDLENIFLDIIKEYTAGNPMNEKKWTNLKKREISEIFKKKGYDVSEHIVGQLLKKNGYKKIQAYKTETYKDVKGRDEQFKNIDKLKNEFLKNPNNPILSIDVKKKSK